MGFLKTILIIIAIFYILNLIGRYLIPYIIKKQLNKFQNNNNFYNNDTKPEGEINIKQTNKKKSPINSDEGEYVDFEDLN